MMIPDTHCCYPFLCYQHSLYLTYPGYILLCLPQIHVAVIHFYAISTHYILRTLDTYCYACPRYTLLLSIFMLSALIISYVPWIHTVMLAPDTHCCYPFLCYQHSLYLTYPGYILLCLPQIHVAVIHLYAINIHHILRTLDTYCYDPRYTVLLSINVLSAFIISHVPWIHTVMMT